MNSTDCVDVKEKAKSKGRILPAKVSNDRFATIAVILTQFDKVRYLRIDNYLPHSNKYAIDMRYVNHTIMVTIRNSDDSEQLLPIMNFDWQDISFIKNILKDVVNPEVLRSKEVNRVVLFKF